MKLYKTAILFAVLIYFISPVSAIGLVDPPSYFEVLPNKTYSSELCVKNDDSGTFGVLELSNKSGLIADFSFDEFKPYKFNQGTTFVDKKPDIQCTTLHIKIADYKTSNEDLIVEKLSYSQKIGNINLGAAHEITFDASEVSYVNALLKFSWRLLLTILSIFVVLTSLLYMIRKIRKE